jgi:hypothetical protein
MFSIIPSAQFMTKFQNSALIENGNMDHLSHLFWGRGTRFFKGSETPYKGRIKVHGLIGLGKDRICQLNY